MLPPAIILLGLVLAYYASTSNFVVRGQFYSGEFRASQRYLCCLECLSLIQGIFLASFGSSRVHSLVIHPEDLEADPVTTDRTDMLRAVRTRAGLVTRIATDVRNGVGLAKTRVSGGE